MSELAENASTLLPEHWLDELRGKIIEHRHSEAGSGIRHAPDFNLFEYLAPDENRLSRAIAQLLDEYATHGQGRLFLDAFLAIRPGIGPHTPTVIGGEKVVPWANPQSNFIDVRLEAPTHLIGACRRRKDIEICFEHDVVVIENKPWACEQHEQVGDYLTELEVRRSNLQQRHNGAVCALYYLTVDGALPNSCRSDQQRNSALCRGHLRCISYADLAAAWRRVLPGCGNERVAVFVSEFTDFMERHLGASMHNRDSLVVDLAIRNTDSVEAALRTAYAVGEVKKQLIQGFIAQLNDLFATSQLKKNGWELTIESGLDGTKHCGISLARSRKSSCKIRYTFDTADYAFLAYGIERRAEGLLQLTTAELAPVLQHIEPTLQVKSNSGLWPWWVEPKSPFLDWRKEIAPWTMMAAADAPLAKNWITRIEHMAEALTEAGLLPHFS